MLEVSDEQLETIANRLHQQYLELETVLDDMGLPSDLQAVDTVQERLREKQELERCQGGCGGWYRSHTLVLDEELGADVCDDCLRT